MVISRLTSQAKSGHVRAAGSPPAPNPLPPWGKRIKASPCQQDCVPDGSTYANGQAKTEASPCQQGGASQTEECSELNLPEDIWHHIHSLMPLKDAARAACVSQSFLSSWRCHSNLILSRESFGLEGEKETARDFRRKIDHILRNHSGTGVRKLSLRLVPNYNAKDRDYINKWLEKAVTPGIEELTLSLPINNKCKYEFLCTVLSNGRGDSLRCLYLTNCSFHPMALLGCLRSLTKLELFMVRIPGDELCCLLSSSSALEWLSLTYCSKVNCLKIPCHLQRLRHVKVEDCSKLRVIENKAPNLSSFQFKGGLKVQVKLGKALQVKSLYMSSTVFGCNTRAELASSIPSREMVNSPMVSSKLTDLKSMIICLGEMSFCLSFDCQSIVSILGASLTLETFISHVSDELMQHALVFGDPSRSWMLDTSGGVVSPLNKSLIKLACHVLRAWLT